MFMLYKELVLLYEKLFSSSKRLDKTYYLSKFLKNLNDNFDIIFLLFKGKIYPDWNDTKIGFAAKMALKSISLSSGISIEKIEQLWKKIGDLGIVAEEVISKKQQSTLFSQELTLKKVFNN